MKTRIFFLAFIILLFLTFGTAAGSRPKAETEIWFNTEFNRGDVVTVLISLKAAGYTLELTDSSGEYITGNIFFPFENSLFKGQAALLGLDSTLKPGIYILLVKDETGFIKNSGSINVRDNTFKKEDITLNYENSSLRTDPDPEIVREAVNIHEIYNRSVYSIVSENSPLLYPLEDGIITSWYGDRRRFIYTGGSDSASIHTGTDIAALKGTFIRAAGRGKVVFAGDRIITGKTVVVEYLPGVYGVFFHMAKLFVSVGESVEANSVVGTLGSTGLATGPHLHWEIRVGGVPVDPYSLIAGGLIDNSLIMSIVSSHTAE